MTRRVGIVLAAVAVGLALLVGVARYASGPHDAGTRDAEPGPTTVPSPVASEPAPALAPRPDVAIDAAARTSARPAPDAIAGPMNGAARGAGSPAEAATSASSSVPGEVPGAPAFWRVVGAPPYAVVADTSTAYSGAHSVRVSLDGGPAGGTFGGVKQVVDADAFRGRRIRFTVEARSEGAAQATIGLSGLDANGMHVTRKFMLVDAQSRPPIRGTTGWTSYAVVVDVPRAARYVEYGVFLLTPGTAWFDAARLEAVDASVATTQPPLAGVPYVAPPDELAGALPAPNNLDFEAVVRN